MKKRVGKIVLGFVVASLTTIIVACSSGNSGGDGSALENVYTQIEGSEKAQVYNLIIIDESGSMRRLEEAKRKSEESNKRGQTESVLIKKLHLEVLIKVVKKPKSCRNFGLYEIFMV